ncbi:MAG TPA: SRPBCC family protein [Bdellovibrionales bacterium]|nr:SRPBCC family protein [Bdellovibrionales bacterium]
MAAASTTENFNCTPEQFFAIVSDYEKYPQFLSEVKSCKVLETKGDKKLVEFHVSVIKTFSYRMWMTETPGKGISWILESGDLFKTSTGSWDLQNAGGKTKARYSVEATFKVFVPGPVAKALVNVNMPNMMRAYQERVKSLYG